MKQIVKLLSTVVIFVLLLSFSAISPVNADEWNAQQRALFFIGDVGGLDLTKYDITLMANRIEYPSRLGGLAEERIEYRFNHEDSSELDILCTFVNKTLCGCIVWLNKGSPILSAAQADNTLAIAKNALRQNQDFSKADYAQTMNTMLDMLNNTSPIELKNDNIKLTISTIQGNATRFEWVASVDGVDFSLKKVSFKIENGFLSSFGNSWGLYSVGCSDVNVSREDAVEIARKQAGEYVLRIFQGGEYVVMNFSLREELVGVEFFDFVREPLVLYPFWKVQLYFDRLYGTADGIEVGIWADTGEVSFCQATGFSGIPEVESNSSSALTPQPSTSVPPSQTPAPVPSQTTPSFSASPSLSSQSPLTEPTATVTPEPKSSTSSTIEPSLSPSLQPQDENLPSVDVFTLGLLAVFAAGIVVTICFVHFMRKNSVSKKSL